MILLSSHWITINATTATTTTKNDAEFLLLLYCGCAFFILTVIKTSLFFYIFSQEKSRGKKKGKTIFAAVVSKDCIYLLNYILYIYIFCFAVWWCFFLFFCQCTVHNYISCSFGHLIDLNRTTQTCSTQSLTRLYAISDAG